jgi:hypothetical protein
MRPLGNLRCRILLCLGADNPSRPAFFDPPIAQPIHDGLHRHLLQLHELFSTDSNARRLVATGLLTFGELQRANEILGRFPPTPIITDHGAGWCALIAYRTVAALLPVPSEVRDAAQWFEGSRAAAAVRQWFTEHREQLHWDETGEHFVYRT